MVIKNSDGSIFKLNSPNPIMKNQKTWNGFILHNMDWNPYTCESDKPKEELKKTEEEYKDSFLEELVKTSNEKIPEKKEVLVKENVTKTNNNFKSNTSIPTTLCCCLPAKEESKTDFLYDEIYKTISYDSPFTLEIVITEENDVSFECWTTVDQVDVGSILYPKNKMKRWWKVVKKEPKTGGFLLKAIISQYQPSFDD